MQDSAVKPQTAFVDLCYRSVDADLPGMHIVYRGKAKRICEQERRQLRRSQAIEPIIGHLKGGLHAVLCAAGYNIRWLPRMMAKKRMSFLRRLYLRLCVVAGLPPN